MTTLPCKITPEAREQLCAAYESANAARLECFGYFNSLREACEAQHNDWNDAARAWSKQVESLHQGSDPKYTALDAAEEQTREYAGQVGDCFSAATGYRQITPEWAARYSDLCSRWKTELQNALN